MLFRNARLIFPDRIALHGHVRVTGGVIAEVARKNAAAPRRRKEATIDLKGNFLAPGFIDLHIHGALGRDTMEAGAEAFRTICRHHAAGGTTALALTTITATRGENPARAARGRKISKRPAAAARRCSACISRGPISPGKTGRAPASTLIRDPQPEEYSASCARGNDHANDPRARAARRARSLIETLRERGIRASAGHSDAWDEDAVRSLCPRASAGHAHFQLHEHRAPPRAVSRRGAAGVCPERAGDSVRADRRWPARFAHAHAHAFPGERRGRHRARHRCQRGRGTGRGIRFPSPTSSAWCAVESA